MVNRKERRLAAKTSSNRRLKLDILAEPPSGDFGDLSNKEGGGNANYVAVSPDSPSSSAFRHFYNISGQRPENPLLLLGQYSDEEVEEESGTDINHDPEKTSLDELDKQEKVDSHKAKRTDEDENIVPDQENKDHSSSLDVLPKLEENGVIEDNTAESLHRDADAGETSGAQTTRDVDSGWKMVLHEESNSYYYWNVLTGETSWEAPAYLTQGNESAYDPKSAPGAEENADMYAHVATQPNNESTNSTIFEVTEINDTKTNVEVHNESYADVVVNDKVESNRYKAIDDKLSDEVVPRYSNDALSNAEAHNTDSGFHDMNVHINQGTVGDPSSDSFPLLQLGESLLEKLCLLEGSEDANDQISKLKLELHIRLADIKSLVPYGSSLLPFWLHSENQLKKLEAAVNNEVLKCSQISNVDEINEPGHKLHEGIREATPSGLQDDSIPVDTASQVETVESHENETIADAVPDVGPTSVEDADMDVEMELEEGEFRESEEDIDVLPPPNGEWIPPPPPDEEPLPPPPPDEPPETHPFPPIASELQTAQPYSFGEQYNCTYPVSGYEYYGQTNTEVPSNGYYVDANGCQYYAAVPNSYPNVTSVMNQGDSVTYYPLQEGSVSCAIGVSSVETSGLRKSVHESIASDQIQSSTEVPPSSLSTRSATCLVTHDDVSVATAPAAASIATSTEPVPKVQPKVQRNKKRTVAAVSTLRSNKKVSGLVDKWKAVKEELHDEEEDEPENAFEILEKKRQREIEQWHAQQIATGEAKDNANFQPLGGDWRERVRRKRAKKSSDVEETLTKTIDDTNQQPDLAELTKQLPSGWQAYWDEGSKQVYYGNSTASETTWIKPIN